MMFDLDKAINQWLKQFKRYRAFGPGELREMEFHIRDHIHDLLSKGHTQKSAFNVATEEFGEIKPMAKEEYTIQAKKMTFRSILKMTLYKNYTKTSYRRLLKHPLSTVINLLGLAIAIGVCVLVYSFGYWVETVDQHHENKESVYLATSFINRNGKMQQWGTSPRPLGEMLKNDFAQIEHVTRIQEQNVVIKQEDQVFHERISFVDASYLDLFTFPLESGEKLSLNSNRNIILNHDMAIKYFGDADPLGEEVVIIFNNGVKKLFNVSGIANEFPDAMAIRFDFLINYENLKEAIDDYDPEDWSQSVGATLIKVDNPKDIDGIIKQMDNYKKLQNEAVFDWQIESFKFEKLATLYQNSIDINRTISSRHYATNKMSHTILTILSLFMLALASVNYINIAIATSSKRLNEIALRKTIGANRLMVIGQHLVENLLTTFLALILGAVFGKYIFVPWFEYQNGYSSGFHFLDIKLWLYLCGVMVVTALVSGLYPALYISKFQAVHIFKGNVKFGQSNIITKVFLGFQLILACILIVCAIMFTQNSQYLQDRGWGYDPQSVLYAQVDDHLMFDKLKKSLNQYSNVEEISGGFDHLGVKNSTSLLKQQEKEYEISTLSIDPNYLSLVGLEMAAGREFIPNSTADRNGMIVNEKFVSQLSLANPLELEYEIDSTKYTIIGVVKDFHFNSFQSAVEPMVFLVGEEENFKNLIFRVAKGTELQSLEFLKKEWSSLFPEIPFRGGLQEDVWGSYFSQLAWHGEFWRIIAYLTVFMAALGLFGMVSLNISGRLKEFSIKKVLGASIRHIGLTIVLNYVWLFVIALALGTPLSYFLVGFFFDVVYPYHIPSNMESPLLASIILVGVLWVVVGSLLVKINNANPVKGLKEE